MNNSFVRCFIKIFSTKCCPSSSQWNKRLRRDPCGRLETTSGRTVPSPGACAERDPGSRDAPGDSPTTTTLAVPSSGSRPAGEAALRTPGSRRTRRAPAPAAATHGLRAAGQHLGSPGSGRGRRPSGPPPPRHVGPLRLACCPRRAALHPRATPGPRAGDVAQVDGPASLCSASDRCHALSRLRLGEVSVTDPQGPGDPSGPAWPGCPWPHRHPLHSGRLHSRTARPQRAPPVPAATCATATPHLVTRHTAIRHRLGHLLGHLQRWCGGDT